MVAQETVELLKEQLHAKYQQISQLHQFMAMDRQERERLAQQLDRAHAQLEDYRSSNAIYLPKLDLTF